MTRSVQMAIKRVLDRISALLLMIVLSPAVVLIALAIRIADGGPAIFRQRRIGWRERGFEIYKFRTMVVNADEQLDERGRVTGSRRVTGIGRVLRFLSLDELPQLANILKGDMSFVGPRPVLPEHLPRYTDEQRQRFLMPPGVTGLAQINGRNQLPWSERIRLDVEYVRRFNLALDAWILLRTVRTVVLREGVVLDRNPEQVDDLPPPRQHRGEGPP